MGFVNLGTLPQREINNVR